MIHTAATWSDRDGRIVKTAMRLHYIDYDGDRSEYAASYINAQSDSPR